MNGSPSRPARARSAWGRTAGPAVMMAAGLALLAACTAGRPLAASRRDATTPGRPGAVRTAAGRTARGGRGPRTSAARAGATPAVTAPGPVAAGPPLPAPARLVPFPGRATPRAGTWHPAGRPVRGQPAVYEASLVPPGGSRPAGIAWMDTRLLAARLYSGSISPGGGPYRYTAPVQPAQAATLVAAFNGGFKMADARGGYYTQGRAVVPLRRGAASLVITSTGGVTVGAWGRDVAMARSVVSVRQNLVPLVAGGRPTAQAASPDWRAWGDTCGAHSCARSVPGVEHQWRSGVGVTADGALVYAAGPALDPLQLAQLLARAGVVRGMQLDINPDWPVFASYDPPGGRGLAAPGNGTGLLPGAVQGPWTFFQPSWARDFVTMSVRG